MKLASLASLAVASLLVGWAGDAGACDDLHTHTSVVGVASDGTFLQLSF